MPGNTDEKEKCLEKLNEMQKFLPFLDFMIDKIKKKNDLPLECQLSKFQHIRSVIIEKNGKYGLESLYNIEDVLLKLVTKLDYKGINIKEKKEPVETKAEALPKIAQGEEETASEAPAAATTKSTTHVDHAVVSISKERKGDTAGCRDSKKDCFEAGNVVNVESSVEKSKESEDVSRDQKPWKDTDSITKSAPLDVLASSRRKLLNSVSGKGYAGLEDETESNKKSKNIDSSSKPVEEKRKNASVSDKFLIGELSDISDDEYFTAENVDSNKKSAYKSESDKLRNVKQLSDVPVWNKEAKLDRKFNESLACSTSYPLVDVSSKQKLRERLSADIAEMHKVPGKSVGGSLRSLKDLKASSQECKPERKKSREMRSVGRSNTPEKLGDSERNRNVKKSSRRERRSKEHRSKDRGRRREQKHHHRSEEEKEDKKGNSIKHSSRTEKENHSDEEERKDIDEEEEEDVIKLIDSFDDKELLAFVSENMSDLPNLSTMSPGEMRRAVRQSYTKENISHSDERDRKIESNEDSVKHDSEHNSESSTIFSEKPTAVAKQNYSDTDEDEYSIRLIEDINPTPRPRLKQGQTEPQPELTCRENPSPVENKDPRMRHSLQVPDIQLEVGHPLSDPRTVHRVPKPLKSPTESPVLSRFLNDNCDPRAFWNVCDEKQTNRQNFPSQRYIMYDSGSNNPSRHHGTPEEHARFSSFGNLVRNLNFNTCEPKCYGEYKQLKRQEMENANRLKLSFDDRINSPESLTTEESNLEALNKKENDGKPIKSPPLNKRSKNRVQKNTSVTIKSATETNRKSFECDRNQERTDKCPTVKIPEEESVSPLDKLYANDPKPVTGRGYGLKNFKIPKKDRSIFVDQTKGEEKDKPCAVSDTRTSMSDVESDNQAEVSEECEIVKKVHEEAKINEQKKEKDGGSERQDQVSKPNSLSQGDVCEIETEKVSIDSSVCQSKKKDTVAVKIDSKNQTAPTGESVQTEETDSSTAPENEVAQIDGDKSAADSNVENEKTADDKNVKTDETEKESEVKSIVESDTGSKSTITEEITQELVEALISKSFESGEGELLLAKAKLFKELALKLNSKKLKTIQKIINSESDSGSSSSRTSSEGEKKKKKTRKKSNDVEDRQSKKTKGYKKSFKSKEYVESSSENEVEGGRSRQSKAATKADKTPSESASDSNEKKVPQIREESPAKSKKSLRKTKLLEQIFNESPARDFDLSMGHQNPSEKESDQKCKTKVKSKGKTELDRLHEDIRNMFISSGVVTATGQRMCRILRETGGKMNNLDLVRESAKMVEEEKLASRRSKRLTNTRSRSRSSDRKSGRDRSRSRSLLSAHDEEMSKALKDRPVVVLERLNLQSMSYAYKITDVPESLTRRRARNVARRGRGRCRGLTRPMNDEEVYWNRRGNIYLARNFRRCLVGKSKTRRRRYKGKKLTEIIEKLPLKMAKIRHLEISNKEPIRKPEKPPTQKIETADKKQKGGYVVEESSEILDYAFEKSKSAYSCLLCGFHTKTITAHYKTEHPESEVLISRLEKSEAIKAVLDSKTFNYDITALEQAWSLEMIKKRVKQKLTGPSTFFCRMCSYGNVTNVSQFFCHISTHTGEYRYKCPVEGCDLAMASRDIVRKHVLSKHQKQKLLSNKMVELFPLPSEHGVLFGYLCSRCNFVQVLLKNIETHIQKVHGGAEDVRAIKIDLSGKASEEKEAKGRTAKRKTRSTEEGGGGTGKGEDDEEDLDPADEEYAFGSEGATESSSSIDDDDDEDYKSSVNLNGDDDYQPRRTRSSLADDKRTKTKETPASTGEDSINDSISKEVQPVIESPKQDEMNEGKDDQNVSGDVTDLDVQKWSVGPLEATISKSDIITFKCGVGQCRYKTHLSTTFEKHVLSKHQSAVWTGVCDSCQIPLSQKEGCLSGIYKIADILEHLENHIKPSGSGRTVENLQNDKSEMHISANLDELQPSQSNEEVSTESPSLPQVPLLRVRSLVGDRLSKPKSLLEEEPIQPESSSNSEPLFTIKDVRSLNPDTEEPEVEEITPQPGTFPPNAEVVGGKPVLIRSCPSPKITISSEPCPIPISLAQAKQGLEIGQLVKVLPPRTVAEVPKLGVNNLGFVAATSIRILSPANFTTQAVIVPKFTATSRLVPLSKTAETTAATASTTVPQSKKAAPKPIMRTGLMPPVALGSDVVIQKIEGVGEKKKAAKRKSPSSAGGQPVTSAAAGEGPQGEHTSAVKRELQYSVPFSGKNIKDANIYKEMLTKTKLCQLFKCMAVECSFTCNNETIFTQHIGLHEAQQRIKGKKKPVNKVNKLFNWQQCAYCCEVLVHTGSALSQHILSDHGHCLYQCAYCFYRAVSPTYVDLHQNTVHDKMVKEKKKLIYKCKPVPGANLSKQYERQIRPQHIRPYQCEHCGSRFLIIQHFLDHMTTQHQSVTAYSCHICKILCFKPDRLIAHYKLHSYSMYQCAYCLHGTENQKEMLYHLWNFHFSQPPVIYARMLDDPSSVRKRKLLRETKKKKNDNIVLDDLKLITFDSDPANGEHNLEEAGSEAEQEIEKKDAGPVPISIDLSAIVSELGIDLDDEKKNSVAEKRSMEVSVPAAVPLDKMLPNAQFSSESEAGKDNPTLLLASVVDEEKKDEKDVSVPIGQLPIELLDKTQTMAQKQSDVMEKQSVDKIIMNLQQKNSSVTVSPVVENKTTEEATPVRSVHKLPPTVPVNRSVIARVYQPKKLAIVNKLDDPHPKDSGPILFHQLCGAQRISTDMIQPQNLLLALPVVETVKNVCQKESDAGLQSPNQKAVSLRSREESSDAVKKAADGNILKRLCLGNPSSPALITVSTLQETPLKISDVRSLSADKAAPVLQPPIIRVEDFAGKRDGPEDGEKPGEPDKSKKQKKQTQKKSREPPSSPEVIILDPEEDAKNSRKELVELVDSEDDSETKKESNQEKTKKVITNNDLEIRKQMEQLRNKMENETDCLLLDDDGSRDGNGGNGNAEKSGDSTAEKTNQALQDQESASLDSAQASEESSDKLVPSEANTQDGDSRTNDSEDSKGGKTDDSLPANEKTIKQEEQPKKKEEFSGKELYLCGNGNCSFAAENAVDLKDHLYICDFSRESAVLICPHCTKHFRHSAPYVEHLKRHGEKKYSCGLCNILSAVESSITQHMKKKHKCSQLKTLPNESKPGHFVIYPKNFKKGKQDGEMNVYSPGDEDKLPLQSIYQENVNCAKCPYFTKVRSNMVRHLKIHIKSVETEGSIVVPSTAPTNPVPCLDTKERMFDKMTNLAASSQLAQANKDKFETLSPEEEAKLPQFIPEQMRHKCCSLDCNYLTIDDNMLKHHIKALHDEINVYSCPHCRETVHLEFRYVPLDKIGQHLKYHDSRLYKCYHCTYFHHQRYIVEKHALEKHPERRFSVFTVREPKMELTSASEEEQQQQHHPAPNEPMTKIWRCGLCEKYENTMRMSVLEHLAKVHNMKSKFKCKFCDTKSSQYSAFAAHFASKHNGQKVECLKALIQVNKPGSESGQSVGGNETSSEHFDTTPLWQRDAPRIRHIRGILIEEEEIKTKKTKKISSDIENEVKVQKLRPPDMFYCPLCTDKKKVFRSKNSETFKVHLYQELNYQQYACMLCGKMFVDRKDCERHHVRAHPNRTLSIKQTKEDSEIKFWVDKVVANQEAQIVEKKRKASTSDSLEESQAAKKKKVQAKPVELAAASKQKQDSNRLTRSSSSLELKTETEMEGSAKRRTSEDKSESMRHTRSGSGAHTAESLKCPHCPHKVNNLSSLKNHIKLKHLKMGKWLCPYCGESFQLEKHATKHCKSSHPDEVAAAEPNPDEQMEELKEDFWLVEYGFGRDTQTKTAGEEKPPERCKPTSTRRESTKVAPTQATETAKKPENTNVYSCGYCMSEVTDQSSIVQHFETFHKNIHSDANFGVVGTIYYQCNVCAEKLMDFESLNVHAREKHPRKTLQFEIRKVYKYDSKDSSCSKCAKKSCECLKSGQTTADKAKDGCYQCPRCPVISTSYLDCIDHFNEHYPRYTCSNCSTRFFTEAEIGKHQEEMKHKMPYAMTIPSENMLEEYKAGVKVKRNGVWQSLQASKRPNSSDDSYEAKKVKSVTARKSTTQVPDRRGHCESDSRGEDAEVSRSEQLPMDVISPPPVDVHTYFFKDEF